MPLPNDPIGAGPDMSQWQNWLMSTLRPPAQPGADALGSSLVAHPGAPPWFQFGGFHPENILQGHAGASLGRFDPNFPVNSAQLGGDTGGLPIGDTAAPAAPAPIDPYGLTRANAPIDPFTLRGGPQPPAATAPAVAKRAAPVPIPGSPAARGPNLGYYRPMSGNARQAQAMTYTDPNDPRIFRGPLATPPATQTIPPTATASVPPGPTPYGPNSARLNPSGNLALTGGNQPAGNGWASAPVPMPPPRPTGWPFNQ